MLMMLMMMMMRRRTKKSRDCEGFLQLPPAHRHRAGLYMWMPLETRLHARGVGQSMNCCLPMHQEPDTSEHQQ